MLRVSVFPALIVASGLFVPATSHADGVTTSAAALAFAGSFFDSITGENVNVSGNVRLVTRFASTSTGTTVYLNGVLPDNVTAVGETSGARYNITGTFAQRFHPSDPFHPGDPILSQFTASVYRPGFPNDPIFPTDPIFVGLTLRFTNDGVLLVGGEGGSTVQVCGESSCRTD